MVIGVILTAARIPFRSETLRQRVVAALEQRLDAQVDLEALTLHFSPTVRVVGSGLAIRHKGRRDVPPLIAVNSFTVHANLAGLWRRHVAHVRLDGLKIHIPPRPEDDDSGKALEKDPTAVRTTPVEDPNSYVKQVIIDQLEAPDAQLMILRSDPDKPVRTWILHRLHMKSLGMDSAMPYETTLTNAVPPGTIEASGSFGPWLRAEPGSTPLDGRFTFDDADLSVFKGISGTLSARGSFDGTLNQIAVDGETDTPDFTVSVGGHPVPLKTTYHAVVDATNGNTTLDPVNATFLGTSLVARGGVYEVKNVKGRIVRLDIDMDSGRLEDIMRLSVNTPKAPMTGRLHLKTKFELPPGDTDVVDKLELDGVFSIENGSFTDPGVQSKINDLSKRASAKMSETTVPKVTSDFNGRFRLGRGRLVLPSVSFDVPGAIVQLGGEYGLRRGTIAFDGNLFMEAKISQTVTGFKSLLLKMADPLFRRNGRTVVPLTISGTRNDPKFGVNMGRVFKRGETPPTPPRTRRGSVS